MKIFIAAYCFFLLSFFTMTQCAWAQNSIDSVEYKKVTSNNYRSYLLRDHKLYTITMNSDILVWDLNTLDTLATIRRDSSFFYDALAADCNNNVYAATSSGLIVRIQPDFSLQQVYKHKYWIHEFCFNSNNELFLADYKGVFSTNTKRYWKRFTHHAKGVNLYRHFYFLKFRLKKYFSIPYISYLDQHDRWWMIGCYGEFGGEVEVFDTKHRKIMDQELNDLGPGSLSPQSVFEDSNGNVFITSGLQHLKGFGCIYKISSDYNITEIVNSADFEQEALTTISIDSNGTIEVIGCIGNELVIDAGAWNTAENKLYFYSNHGFYSCTVPDTGLVNELTLVASPLIQWHPDKPGAEPEVSMRAMEFLPDNRLLFMTDAHGFGLYDGKKFVMFR